MTELELRARDLLRRFPLIDGHNDLPWALRVRADPELSQAYGLAAVGQIPNPDDPADIDLAVPVKGLHTDLPRLEAGGVGAQFWSVYVRPPPAKRPPPRVWSTSRTWPRPRCMTLSTSRRHR